MTFFAAIGILVLTTLGMLVFPRLITVGLVMFLCYQNGFGYFGGDMALGQIVFSVMMIAMGFAAGWLDIIFLGEM